MTYNTEIKLGNIFKYTNKIVSSCKLCYPRAMPSLYTKYNFLLQFKSILSDIINKKLPNINYINYSKYNLMKKQQNLLL